MLEIQDFRDFSISNWYRIFENITQKTFIIELPHELPETLLSDENEVTSGDLPTDFQENLKNALNALDKNAFVKNNWHAPTDARMFSFGNMLKVNNLEDILMYFTTSGIIQEDFCNIKGLPFCLALRKWINIHPAAEFRCIVINNVLRGITPRDWPTYYAHYKEEGPKIIEDLSNFYNENIKLKFPRSNYTFDVILSKNVPDDIAPVFRYLESDIGIMTRRLL
ncbi:hypothetical protein NQ317_009457 [Molorchus minor]|uniref:Uncharacterized protein n=1 Tax=Molorchus minor TaxID=1323400 RepID=A0ABQ9JVK5_9CUCU|nr:hypothetical protein NQ317_009457 [Molorchus minor]